MEGNLAINRDVEMLKRILALFLSLAGLADRACGRSWPVRWLVIWALRRSETIALGKIVDAGELSLYYSLAQHRGNSLAEARRLARCFRAAARSVKKLLKTIARCQGRRDPERRDELPFAVGCRFAGCDLSSANGLPRHDALPNFVERRDSS